MEANLVDDISIGWMNTHGRSVASAWRSVQSIWQDCFGKIGSRYSFILELTT